MRAAFWACIALASLSFWGLIIYLVIYLVGTQPMYGHAAAVCGIATVAFGLIAALAHRWSE